ncbi:MAG: DUF4157 domain-containing protein [Leptolyngbya sp. SIOISBB]|nr:DUF4157 domain-containing protein [Leptolyngbya sp. SIOISBB]
MAGDMGGGDNLGGMGDMTDAMGGGDNLGGMGDLGGMAEMVGDSDMGKMVGAMDEGGAMGEGQGEGPEAEEITEMLGTASDIDIGMGDEGIEADIRKAISAGGHPLPEEMQAKLRSRLGMENPEDIQVHTGGAANALCDQLGALAFTTGNHIFFAAGEYDPDSPEGQELIFHEAVHTVQQGAIDGGGGDETFADTQTEEPVQTATDAGADSAEASGNAQTDAADTDASTAETDADVDADAPEVDKGDLGEAGEGGTEKVEGPSNEVFNQASNLLKLPPIKPEPEPVSAPDSMGEVMEPESDVGWDDAEGMANDSATETVESESWAATKPDSFDTALAGVLTFADEDAGDALNLQLFEAGDTVKVPAFQEDINETGTYSGPLISSLTMTGKLFDVANVFAGDKSVFARSDTMTPFTVFAWLLEMIIVLMELVTGIMGTIGLVLTALAALFGLFAAIFMALWYAMFSLGMATVITAPPVSSFAFAMASFFSSAGNFSWSAMQWFLNIPPPPFIIPVPFFPVAPAPNLIGWLGAHILAITKSRMIFRVLAIQMWLLDALLAGVIYGWDAAEDRLKAALNQTISLAADAVAVATFNVTAGKTPTGNAIAPGATGSSLSSAISGQLGKGASRAARKLIGSGIGTGKKAAFTAMADEEGGDTHGTVVEGKIEDVNKLQMLQDSSEDLNEAYENNEVYQERLEAYEESKEALPPLPEDEGLLELEDATIMLGLVSEEECQTEAAIAETQELIGIKQTWAEEMFYTQEGLAMQQAQQDQSQAIAGGYQDRAMEAKEKSTEMGPDIEATADMGAGTSTAMDAAEPMVAASSALAGAGKIFGIDAGGSEGDQAASAGVDASGDMDNAGAQGPASASDSQAAMDQAYASQENYIGESQQAQADIAESDQVIADTQDMNQSEIEYLLECLAELYEYREMLATEKEDARAQKDDGLDSSESWSEETVEIIQGFLDVVIESDEAGGDDEAVEEMDEEDIPDAEELDAEDDEENLTLEEALTEFMVSWAELRDEIGEETADEQSSSLEEELEPEPVSADSA